MQQTLGSISALKKIKNKKKNSCQKLLALLGWTGDEEEGWVRSFSTSYDLNEKQTDLSSFTLLQDFLLIFFFLKKKKKSLR